MKICPNGSDHRHIQGVNWLSSVAEQQTEHTHWFGLDRAGDQSVSKSIVSLSLLPVASQKTLPRPHPVDIPYPGYISNLEFRLSLHFLPYCRNIVNDQMQVREETGGPGRNHRSTQTALLSYSVLVEEIFSFLSVI